MARTPNDILESLGNVIRQCPDLPDGKFGYIYPATQNFVGLEKLPNERLISEDMLGNVRKQLTYELTVKSKDNLIPQLRKVAVFISDNINEVQSSNGSFEIVEDADITDPELTSWDENYRYFSIDISLLVEFQNKD